MGRPKSPRIPLRQGHPAREILRSHFEELFGDVDNLIQKLTEDQATTILGFVEAVITNAHPGNPISVTDAIRRRQAAARK